MSELEPDDADLAEPIDPPEEPEVIDVSIWKSLIEGLISLEHQVAEAHADSPHDELLELRDCILLIQQRAAALRQRIDQAFASAITAHGPIEAGPIRYVVGIDRSTRCVDRELTAEHLLAATGGDFNQFCQQLVAQPFKPASVRAVIPPQAYELCFETAERSNVEKLMKVDTRFLPRR